MKLAFILLCGLVTGTQHAYFKQQTTQYDLKYLKESDGKESFKEQVEAAVTYLRMQLASASNITKAHEVYRQTVLDLAEKAPKTHITDITPDILLKKRKFQFGNNTEGEWLTPIDAQFRKLETKVNFIDITDTQDYSKAALDIPSVPMHRVAVRNFLHQVSMDNIRLFLEKYTSHYNRYFVSSSGIRASVFLYNTLNGMVSNKTTHVTVNYFEHDWPQSSIIARFPGSESNETVIVGCHLDSINQYIPWFGNAPGADDDGSGVATNVELFRILFENDYKPRSNLEIHFYAAEEVGLRGSQDIAQHYAKQNVPVKAMLQIDRSGHNTTIERVGIVEDYTDPALTNFLRNLVETYTDLPWYDMKCGYGCSDHAAWNKLGFRSAFPIEDPDIASNSNIHSNLDTTSTLNFHHIHQFTQLAIGFAVELSI